MCSSHLGEVVAGALAGGASRSIAACSGGLDGVDNLDRTGMPLLRPCDVVEMLGVSRSWLYDAAPDQSTSPTDGVSVLGPTVRPRPRAQDQRAA